MMEVERKGVADLRRELETRLNVQKVETDLPTPVEKRRQRIESNTKITFSKTSPQSNEIHTLRHSNSAVSSSLKIDQSFLTPRKPLRNSTNKPRPPPRPSHLKNSQISSTVANTIERLKSSNTANLPNDNGCHELKNIYCEDKDLCSINNTFNVKDKFGRHHAQTSIEIEDTGCLQPNEDSCSLLIVQNEMRKNHQKEGTSENLLRVQSFTSNTSRSSSQFSEPSDVDDSPTCSIHLSETSQKLFYAADETYTSELRYVKVLKALAEDFPDFVQSESNICKSQVVPSDLCQTFVTTFKPLLNLHQVIATDLGKKMDNWNPEKPDLAKVFIRNGPFIKLSKDAIKRQEQLMNEITEACNRSSDCLYTFSRFEHKHFGQIKVRDQLVCVLQRVYRYPNLIKAYIKYLDPKNYEFRVANDAHRLLEDITRDVNETLANESDSRALLDIQRRLHIPATSKFEVFVPGRRLIKLGEIMKHSRKEVQSRHLLLFNDILLYCASVLGTSNMVLRNEFELNGLEIFIPNNEAVLVDQQQQNYFEFELRGWKRSIIVLARSEKERNDWVNAIETAVDNMLMSKNEKESDHHRRKSQPSSSNRPLSEALSCRSLSLCSTNGLVIKNLGKRAPTWVPDEKVTMCQCCCIVFTTFRRRHHCRACGRIICKRCSGRAPLEHENFKANLVCPFCYRILYSLACEDQLLPDDVTHICRQSLLISFKAPATEIADEVLVTEEDCAAENDETFCCGSSTTSTANMDENANFVILLSGYLNFLENNNKYWTRYWVVLRQSGVLELFSAQEDPVAKVSIVLPSHELERSASVKNVQKSTVSNNFGFFDLVHHNQHKVVVEMNNRRETRYCFRAESQASADKWAESIDKVKSMFY